MNIIPSLLRTANLYDQKGLFEKADFYTKIAQQHLDNEKLTEEEWLRLNAEGDEDYSELAPDSILDAFMQDMAEAHIHKDNWPDTWVDWCAQKAESYKQNHLEEESDEEDLDRSESMQDALRSYHPQYDHAAREQAIDNDFYR